MKNKQLPSMNQRELNDGLAHMQSLLVPDNDLVPEIEKSAVSKPKNSKISAKDIKGGETFDGVYFESIEKLVACSQIDKLKKTYELKEKIKWSKQIRNIEDQSPDLSAFIKNQEIFEKYFNGDKNALSSLKLNDIISKDNSESLNFTSLNLTNEKYEDKVLFSTPLSTPTKKDE